MLLVSLTPPGITPESFQLILRVSGSASGNLRPPWLLRSLNGQFLSATLGWASVFINEWVSLWDRCMGWGLGSHHSSKFLSHLTTPKSARRSIVTFLQSKALVYSPHFYPDKFYKGSWFEEKRPISLLPNHSTKPLSPLQQSNFGIFQPRPRYSSIFFNPAPTLSTFPPGGNFSLSSNRAQLSV